VPSFFRKLAPPVPIARAALRHGLLGAAQLAAQLAAAIPTLGNDDVEVLAEVWTPVEEVCLRMENSKKKSLKNHHIEKKSKKLIRKKEFK
jgi:hypothetical protein